MSNKNTALRIATSNISGHPVKREMLRATRQKLAVRLEDGITLINITDIVRCEADSNYCHIYMKDDRKLVVSKTLLHIMRSLPASVFVRVHQSHTVNLSAITQLGRDGLVLGSGAMVPVSKRRRSDLLRALERIATFL